MAKGYRAKPRDVAVVFVDRFLVKVDEYRRYICSSKLKTLLPTQHAAAHTEQPRVPLIRFWLSITIRNPDNIDHKLYLLFTIQLRFALEEKDSQRITQ